MEFFILYGYPLVKHEGIMILLGHVHSNICEMTDSA